MTTYTTPEVLTLEQAASYLQVQPNELATALEQGEIPGRKVLGKWRISPHAIQQMLGVSVTEVPPPATNGNQIKQPTLPQNNVVKAPSPLPTVNEIPAPQIVISRPRAKGKVWKYNRMTMEATVDMGNGSYVTVSPEHVEGGVLPISGDRVELAIVTQNGKLYGRDARIIESDGNEQKQSPVTIHRKPKAKKQESKSTQFRTNNTHRSRPRIPTKRTTINMQKGDWEKVYNEAAVAFAEGDYDTARSLFRQSLSLGAGVETYRAYFKMVSDNLPRQNRARQLRQRRLEEARGIAEEAIERFPDKIDLYEMYGAMERNNRNFQEAERVFRRGLKKADSFALQLGLFYTLIQINSDQSWAEAKELFPKLEKRKSFKTSHILYQRFKALQNNPVANYAYDFFRYDKRQVLIATTKNLRSYVTDLVVDIQDDDLKEMFGVSGEYLVRCYKRDPSNTDLRDLMDFLESSSEHRINTQDRKVTVSSTLVFVAVPTPQRENDLQDQIMSLTGNRPEAIVPLTVDDFYVGGAEEEIPSILSRRLIQYWGVRDLYDSEKPVSGRRFFGRDNLLRELNEEVRNGRFIGIFGLRKMGKTSLVHTLLETLSGEGVAYVDLLTSQANVGSSCDPIYYEIERDLYMRLSDQDSLDTDYIFRLGRFDRYTDIRLNGHSHGQIFNEDLQLFLNKIVHGETSIKHLVIFLDELERILPVGKKGKTGYIELFGLLRGLAQQYDGYVSNIVVAANASISDRGYLEGQENPVYAFYKSVFLEPLLPEECEQMIRTLGRQMSVYWEPESIKRVLQETAGHPFFTRLLCSFISKTTKNRPLTITYEMVENAIIPFLESPSGVKLSQITELLHENFPEEERLLEQIALGQVKENISTEALSHLLGYSLIRKIEDGNGGYQITMKLLEKYLRRRHGVS